MNGEISAAVTGLDADDQRGLDEAMIRLAGTDGNARLGANAILGGLDGCGAAASAEADEPLWRYLGGEEASLLPVPTMNVLNGGVQADNPVDFQEFMIAPVGATSFAQANTGGQRGVPRAPAHAEESRRSSRSAHATPDARPSRWPEVEQGPAADPARGSTILWPRR